MEIKAEGRVPGDDVHRQEFLANDDASVMKLVEDKSVMAESSGNTHMLLLPLILPAWLSCSALSMRAHVLRLCGHTCCYYLYDFEL